MYVTSVTKLTESCITYYLLLIQANLENQSTSIFRTLATGPKIFLLYKIQCIFVLPVLKFNVSTTNHCTCTSNKIPHSCVMHQCLLMCSKFVCEIFTCNTHIPFKLWLLCTTFLRKVTT